MELSINITFLVQIANFGIAYLLLKKLYIGPVATALLQEEAEAAQERALLLEKEVLLIQAEEETEVRLSRLKRELHGHLPSVPRTLLYVPQVHAELATIENTPEEATALLSQTILTHIKKHEQL